MTQSPNAESRGGPWVFGQVALMLACGAAGWLWTGAWQAGWFDRFAALLLLLAGAAFGIAGVSVLGRNRTIFPEPRPDGSLVEHGIYRYIRHPLYSSVILLGFAWGVWRQSPVALVSALFLTLFLVRKADSEEARLLRRFPRYQAYRDRTHRFLPGLI